MLKLAVVPVRPPVNVPPVNGSLVSSATVMFAEPLKETPLIVRAVVRVSALGWYPSWNTLLREVNVVPPV